LSEERLYITIYYIIIYAYGYTTRALTAGDLIGSLDKEGIYTPHVHIQAYLSKHAHGTYAYYNDRALTILNYYHCIGIWVAG